MSSEKVILIFVALFFAFSMLESGFGQAKFELFTPDPQVNRRLVGRPISEVDLLVYEEGPAGLTIDPVLPSNWRWMAGKGFTSKGQRVEFIFWEGHLYASSVEVCAFRNREYPDLITDLIQGNAFVIGMRKHDETLVFVATTEPKDVHLVIDKNVFGEEKQLDFHLGKNEGTLIRIFPLQPPFRP